MQTILGTKVSIYLERENKPPKSYAYSGPFLWRSLKTITRDTNKEILPVVKLSSPLHLKLTIIPRNSQHALSKTPLSFSS